ncbi:hypothetical protein FSP39_024135 [Pinctada imbricata]|uniref:Mini-chromosome maintenance complex-binding protein n=1 Tax=Pinctada imbricata TaxID=66713 RepID=A0AA89C231_PINIB|nr:hypothetical protein FSP39_024135 [Pinctada imbricata]
MFDPEFYLGLYEVRDKETNQSSMKSGKFKDIAECAVINSYADKVGKHTAQPSTSQCSSRSKRSLDDNIGDSKPSVSSEDSTHVSMETGGSTEQASGSGDTNMDAKKTKTHTIPESTPLSKPDLNFPLPGEDGLSCLVKIYDEVDTFAVNDMVEFVGVLSVDPSLANFSTSTESDGVQSSVEGLEETMEERHAHAPPPSLVPRIHTVVSLKMNHNNPQLHLASQDHFKQELEKLQSEVSILRGQIMSTLEHALFGDKLAAEYFLCHLISSVYGRADVMPLGKFSLNLTQCPAASNYGELIYTFLSAMVTKSHLLPLTIDNMNSLRLCPEKDYTANRLRSGVLQLAADTALVVDETKLQPGQLQATGVKNLTALGTLISWQKVEYDFSYHKQDFISNVSVLIISEAKSILPSDCMVPLVPEVTPTNLREHFSSLDSVLTPEFLQKVRTFITLTRQVPYSVTDDVQKAIQDDFVEMRKDDPKNMTVDDLHTLLNFVR